MSNQGRMDAEAKMAKRAVHVLRKDGQGEGHVYRLDPPHEGHEYVWVSAAVGPYSGPETNIFGCDSEGDVTEWRVLDGSYRGGLDHEEALRNAGYEVVPGLRDDEPGEREGREG